MLIGLVVVLKGILPPDIVRLLVARLLVSVVKNKMSCPLAEADYLNMAHTASEMLLVRPLLWKFANLALLFLFLLLCRCFVSSLLLATDI